MSGRKSSSAGMSSRNVSASESTGPYITPKPNRATDQPMRVVRCRWNWRPSGPCNIEPAVAGPGRAPKKPAPTSRCRLSGTAAAISTTVSVRERARGAGLLL